MPNVAIVVLAGTEAPSDMGRVVNGLQTAQEFDEEGDDVEIIFDGAGTQWIPELADEDHDYHSLYAGLTDLMSACIKERAPAFYRPLFGSARACRTS